MGLINQNYDLIRAIVNNQTSIAISYDLDLLKQGDGVLLDRSTENQVIVNNSTQDFNITGNNGYGTLVQRSINEIPLANFSNYFKHVNNSTPLVLTEDMTISINDYPNTWKNGQRFRLSFGDKVYPGNYIINILTDSQGKYPVSLPTGIQYSNIIISLDSVIFESADNEPVFDIVCIDDKNLKFQVDVVGKSLTNNQ
jgi:hypothetical protein